MANISKCFEQFHDFNNSMFFQGKKDKVDVTICDMASKVIYSSEVPNDILNGMAKDKGDANDLKTGITELLDRGYKPHFNAILSRIFLVSPTAHEVDYSSIKKGVDDVIAYIEPKVEFEPSQISDYTCSLSGMLLKDPVVDGHGHTFERESIERWLKINKRCPIEGNLMDVRSLIPNVNLRKIIEVRRKKKFAVPSRNLFEGTNEKLAKSSFKLGFIFEEEKKFVEAFKFYRKALKYTNKAEDYRYIPVILEQMEKNQSACLAYLYLAKYQIEEEKFDSALESLIRARDLQSHDIELNNPIAIFHKEMGRDEEAFALFIEMGDRFAKSLKKMASMSAIEAYKNAISVNPNAYEIYLKLADQIQEKQQKANVFLTAANHFMKKDVVLAEKLATTAHELAPENPLNYFPHIQALKMQKKIDELVKAYLNLSNVYKNIKDKKNKRICLREEVELKPSGQIYERITKSYLKSGKNEKSLQYFLKWIEFPISERRWNAAETIAQRALVHFKENVYVLEGLEKIYNNFLGEHLQSLLFRLAKAYVLNKDLESATSRYTQLWERFHNGEAYFEVAKILMNQENPTKAVKVLFELARHSLLRSNMILLDKCVQTILEKDPELKFLSSDQQLTFLSFSHIGKLTSQVQDLTRRFDHSQCKDIYESCAIGDIAHVEQMVKAIKDPDKIKEIIELPNDEGLNLLHIAVLKGQLEIAALLKELLNGDVSKPINSAAAHELAGLSPIDIAAKDGNNALVELLQAGSKPFVDNEKNPLHFSVENGHFLTAELLLSFDIPTNLREPNNGYTAFHLAVLNGKLGITKLLLSSSDIDPNLPDKDGYRPLAHAVEKTRPDFVRVICECKKTVLSSDEIDSLLVKNEKNLKDDKSDQIREIEQILKEAKINRGLRDEEDHEEKEGAV